MNSEKSPKQFAVRSQRPQMELKTLIFQASKEAAPGPSQCAPAAAGPAHRRRSPSPLPQPLGHWSEMLDLPPASSTNPLIIQGLPGGFEAMPHLAAELHEVRRPSSAPRTDVLRAPRRR